MRNMTREEIITEYTKCIGHPPTEGAIKVIKILLKCDDPVAVIERVIEEREERERNKKAVTDDSD